MCLTPGFVVAAVVAVLPATDAEGPAESCEAVSSLTACRRGELPRTARNPELPDFWLQLAAPFWLKNHSAAESEKPLWPCQQIDPRSMLSVT